MKSLLDFLKRTIHLTEECFIKIQLSSKKRTLEETLATTELVVCTTHEIDFPNEKVERIQDSRFKQTIRIHVQETMDIEDLYEYCRFLHLKNQLVNQQVFYPRLASK